MNGRMKPEKKNIRDEIASAFDEFSIWYSWNILELTLERFN